MKVLNKLITPSEITYRYTLEVEKENGDYCVIFIDSDRNDLSDSEIQKELYKRSTVFYKKMSKSSK